MLNQRASDDVGDSGGERLTDNGLDRGFYVEPTVFSDVDPGTALAQQEVFGPVAAVFSFDEWPTGEEERRAVLQWRFQHDEGIAVVLDEGDRASDGARKPVATRAYRLVPGVTV